LSGWIKEVFMDADRQPDIHLNVQVSDIIESESTPNMRGPEIGDTVDLQASIREIGIEEPLWVSATDDGKFFLIEGRRRLAAARRVGLEEVPVLVKDVDEMKFIDLMLTADMRKKQAPIVLDRKDRVVGGLCWAFYKQVEAGRRKIDIALARGVPTDTVGAYCALYDDFPEMKRAVARGRIAITVYALMKHSDKVFKAYILRKKGNITARVVRKAIKEWPYIKYQIEQSREEVEVTESPEVETFEPTEEDDPVEHIQQPTAALINQAIQNMAIVAERELEPIDVLLVDKFVNIMEVLVDQMDEILKEVSVDRIEEMIEGDADGQN
jgi:uncharacterized ParB-like nuclease family protein